MVESVCKRLFTNYVSEPLALQMMDTLKGKLNRNGYDSTLNIDEFAYAITKDMRRVSHDAHISVSKPIYKLTSYFSDYAGLSDRQIKKEIKKNELEFQKYLKAPRYDMYTYGDVKIMDGNIGYVEIKDFHQKIRMGKKTSHRRIRISDVMTFFKNTNTIIFDLRNNRGGYLREAARFCSYFSPVPHNYFISSSSSFRYDSMGVTKYFNFIDTTYTSAVIDDQLTNSKTIYFLTSNRTFSAGELVVYKAKRYNPRIIIVGEPTIGGGNGHAGPDTDLFASATIPCFNGFDESNKNYSLEAKGIVPDIVVSADSAFEIAYTNAKTTTPRNTRHPKTRYLNKEKGIDTSLENVFRKFYGEYQGKYHKIEIIYEGGKLFLLEDELVKERLIPEAQDYFTAEGVQFIRFKRNREGKIFQVYVKWTDRFDETFTKEN